MKQFKPRSFWISCDEIRATMQKGELGTVSAAVRLLVPDVQMFKCAKGGYWGVRRGEWGAGCGTPVVPHPAPHRRRHSRSQATITGIPTN